MPEVNICLVDDPAGAVRMNNSTDQTFRSDDASRRADLWREAATFPADQND